MNEVYRYQVNANHSQILKILLQKDVTTYSTFSYPLCGILWDNRQYWWLYNLFIHLYSLTKDGGGFWLDYMEQRDFYKDVADYSILDSDTMNREPDIIRFIEEKIAAGYYIIIFVDKYYLPHLKNYRTMHFVHQIMIYGYDRREQVFNTIAYDDKYNFTGMVHSYEAMQDAYETGKSYYNQFPPWVKKENVELIKPRFNQDVTFNLEKFLTDFKAYISGTGNLSRVRPLNIQVYGSNAHYNTGIYAEFIRCFKESNGDFRFFHLLAEYKSLMHKRLKFIADLYRLNADFYGLAATYRQVEEKFTMARNLYIKDGLSNNWVISREARTEIIGLMQTGQAVENTVLAGVDVFLNSIKQQL